MKPHLVDAGGAPLGQEVSARFDKGTVLIEVGPLVNVENLLLLAFMLQSRAGVMLAAAQAQANTRRHS
jgi:hypothetical protein